MKKLGFIFFFLCSLIWFNEDLHADVTDTIKPEILDLETTIAIEINSDSVDYLEYIQATDNYDDPNMLTITVDDSKLDLTELGTYPITYHVTDTSGNTVSASTEVLVKDDTKPILRVASEIRIQLIDNHPYNLWDQFILEESDNSNKPVHMMIAIEKGLDYLGEQKIEFIAWDDSNNKITVTRKLIIVDEIPPTIVQKQNFSSSYIEVHGNQSDLIKNFQITDNYKTGDLTIDVDDQYVHYHQVGTYPITITVTDSFNNQAILEAEIPVKDKTSPEITVEDTIKVTAKTEVNWYSFITTTDNYDDNVTVIIDESRVNLNKVGTYTITYIATDDYNNETSQQVTVIVGINYSHLLTIVGTVVASIAIFIFGLVKLVKFLDSQYD